MNLVAILIASVAGFGIAALWYGPLFGKIQMELTGYHPTGNEPPPIRQMIQHYLLTLLTAIVMAGAFQLIFTSPFMGEPAWYRGAILGFWLWLGFVAPSAAYESIWAGRSWKLWIIDNSGALVGMLLMGAILAAW